ncbi:MAG: hypoxanthine phosphoribosyltransferase [Egibacteraceae bacterium]
MHPDIEEITFDAETIAARVVTLAAEIDRDYAGKEILLVGVLKGAFVLMADLARELSTPTDVDFMAVSSYGSSTQSSGVVRILKDLDRDISGRHVLLVEDILDSGLTLQYLVRNLGARKPASLAVITLLTKPDPLRPDVPLYEGFAVPDRFVVGYGLDYDQAYRGLPYIGVLKPEIYA